MPKKDSKKKGKKDKAAAGAAEAVEAVRAAVERTFTASAEGAKSTGGRAKDVTAAANRIREVLEDRVLEELKGLRGDVEGLARRVSARVERAQDVVGTRVGQARLGLDRTQDVAVALDHRAQAGGAPLVVGALGRHDAGRRRFLVGRRQHDLG